MDPDGLLGTEPKTSTEQCMVSIKESLSENFGNTVSSTFLFKLDLFLIHSVDYLFLILNAWIISLLPELLLSYTH